MKIINVGGDLFATAICFIGIAAIKLASSVVLTRILYPEAYGIVTILASIGFAVEMLSDLGALGFMVRTEHGDARRYINTVWTLRLIRGCAIFALLFACAPLIASVYETPALTGALRVYSAWFVFYGLESMSFTLAIRHQKARITSYSELLCTLLSTIFIVVFSFYSRDYWGMIYGIVLNRILMTLMSYLFYRDLRPRLQFDREAAKDLFGFTKFVMPSSIITLGLSQFDKIIFLKFFDLHLLGLYGLAANIAAPIDTLTARVCRSVLYPRCASSFRADSSTFAARYYKENVKLFLLIMFLPAAVGGASYSIIDFLYDSRYSYAGMILQAFTIRSMLLSLASPAENMLVASGGASYALIGNIFRLGWLIPGSVAGYYFWGFEGFVYCAVLDVLAALLYFAWVQHRRRILVVRYELLKLAYMSAVFLSFVVIGRQLPGLAPISDPAAEIFGFSAPAGAAHAIVVLFRPAATSLDLKSSDRSRS